MGTGDLACVYGGIRGAEYFTVKKSTGIGLVVKEVNVEFNWQSIKIYFNS